MAKISSDITESFVEETNELLEQARHDVITLKNIQNDENTLANLLRNLHTIKGNARMLGFLTIEKLSHALEDIYKSVKDGQVKNSDRLVKLVFAVADKIQSCTLAIRNTGTDDSDIELYLRYCDKLAAGELIDTDAFVASLNKQEANETDSGEDDENTKGRVGDSQSIRIKLSRVNEIIATFDTMITREFHLKHQLDELHLKCVTVEE